MALKYFLVDNALTPNPTDCRAVSKHDKTITMKQIIDLINYRNVGVTRSQIVAVLDEFMEAIKMFLKEGDKIQTTIFTITPTVSGVFIDMNDTFDRSRHGININISPRGELEVVSDIIEPIKIQQDKNLPQINTFFDITTDQNDAVITPGLPAKIFGFNLRVDQADDEQGVYFTRLSNNKDTKVSVFIDNNPSKLSIVVPALPAGDYALKVKAKINGKLYTTEHFATLQVV